MVEISNNYLMLGGRAQILCSAVQILILVKAVFTLKESVTFGKAEGNKQNCENEMFDQEKQCLVCIRGRQISIETLGGKVFLTSEWMILAAILEKGFE